MTCRISTIRRGAMKYLRLGVVALLAMVLQISAAQALELKRLKTSDLADANQCGDYNRASLYEITSLDADEVQAFLPGQFILTPKGFEKIKSVLSLADRNSKGFIVTASFRQARSLLEEAWTSSCQPDEVKTWFGLAGNVTLPEANYFVFGEVSSNGIWADEFRHHIAVDLKRMRLATFLIW